MNRTPEDFYQLALKGWNNYVRNTPQDQFNFGDALRHASNNIFAELLHEENQTRKPQ